MVISAICNTTKAGNVALKVCKHILCYKEQHLLSLITYLHLYMYIPSIKLLFSRMNNYNFISVRLELRKMFNVYLNTFISYKAKMNEGLLSFFCVLENKTGL